MASRRQWSALARCGLPCKWVSSMSHIAMTITFNFDRRVSVATTYCLFMLMAVLTGLARSGPAVGTSRQQHITRRRLRKKSHSGRTGTLSDTNCPVVTPRRSRQRNEVRWISSHSGVFCSLLHIIKSDHFPLSVLLLRYNNASETD